MPSRANPNLALLTDLYEVTMAASYLEHGLNRPATFDLFIRELPPERHFIVSCGLEPALDHLESLRLEMSDISYLSDLGLFEAKFLSYLEDMRFTGEVRAVPEGEIVFPGEPLLQVTAPLIEAQFVETFLLNCITSNSMVASKAARIHIACRDRSFVDFSLRRDHGPDAGIQAARAAYVAGAAATSNVLAGKLYGIPLSGTMAHSYVMAFESEIEAFRAYANDFGDSTILLIDTFDVEQGARNAASVAKEMKERGTTIRGVRIDSGDLAILTRNVRKILDDSGLHNMTIVLSGDLDEYRIDLLLQDGAPADSFGVGTQLGTSGDAPSLGGAYKLVDDERGPKIKLSTGKATIPGRKQVYRRIDGDEIYDVIALEREEPVGRPLLETVMRDGERKSPSPPLADVRARFARSLAQLPARFRSLERRHEDPPVKLSDELHALVRRMQQPANRG